MKNYNNEDFFDYFSQTSLYTFEGQYLLMNKKTQPQTLVKEQQSKEYCESKKANCTLQRMCHTCSHKVEC